MYKKLFAILLFLLLPFPLYAQTTDSSTIEMYQTVVLEKESEIYTIQDVTVESPVSRDPNIGAHVEGVPGTKFNLVFTYFNYSTEDILIEKIFFPMNTENSNFWRLLSNKEGIIEKEIHTKWGNIDQYRYSKGKEYDVNLEIVPMVEGRYVLDEFEIGESLEITDIQMTPDHEEGKIYFTVWVKNLTTELLNNVVFEHQTYSYTQNILPGDEVIYQYSLDTDFSEEDIFFGRIKMMDPSTKTECASEGNRWYQYHYPKGISVYSYIANSWISGLYIQPERDSLCITRLPHEIYSEEILYKKEFVDNSVEKDTEPEVLGAENEVDNTLTELPKTAYKKISFIVGLLVADIYLWYSVFNKRRKYGSKN